MPAQEAGASSADNASGSGPLRDAFDLAVKFKPIETFETDPQTQAEIDMVVSFIRQRAGKARTAVRWAHFCTRIVALPLGGTDKLRLVELVKQIEMDDSEGSCACACCVHSLRPRLESSCDRDPPSAAAAKLHDLHCRLSTSQIVMTATIPILIPLGMHLKSHWLGDVIHTLPRELDAVLLAVTLQWLSGGTLLMRYTSSSSAGNPLLSDLHVVPHDALRGRAAHRQVRRARVPHAAGDGERGERVPPLSRDEVWQRRL